MQFRVIEELFLGFYQASMTSSNVIQASVNDVLLRFQQSYDGLANVFGYISGLPTRILKDDVHIISTLWSIAIFCKNRVQLIVLLSSK